MEVFIEKQPMQSNGKRTVNSIAAVFLLLLLSALTSVSAHEVGETFRDCATCPEMVVLPAGKFMMGSPEVERGGQDDEGPQHQVTIPKPFAVGKYEVTVGQYAEFVRETKHKHTGCGSDNNHPVGCISWHDASAYANWLSTKTDHKYRLLTEAEWEYAARAGTTTMYYFGPMISTTMARYESKDAIAVGSFAANSFGLHDMQGNAWEWVEDCWHDNYIGAPTNGSAWIKECDIGDLHVLRGGSWYDRPANLRSANRFGYNAASRSHADGIRVARVLSP